MNKTEPKPNEEESQNTTDDFEQFVKNLFSVPKEEVDEITRQDRKKQKEEKSEKKKSNN